MCATNDITVLPPVNHCTCANYKTDERESPQEAKPARENSSLGFFEAVHQ